MTGKNVSRNLNAASSVAMNALQCAASMSEEIIGRYSNGESIPLAIVQQAGQFLFSYHLVEHPWNAMDIFKGRNPALEAQDFYNEISAPTLLPKNSAEARKQG